MFDILGNKCISQSVKLFLQVVTLSVQICRHERLFGDGKVGMMVVLERAACHERTGLM